MKLSNCCGADIIENSDVCSECGEHCEVVEDSECLSTEDLIKFEEIEDE